MEFWRSIALFLCGLVILGCGSEIGIYEIKRRDDFSVTVSNYGARITSVVLPDKHGNLGDVVLGFDTIEQYMNDSSYMGAIVGRVANRIAGAHFTLNGTLYSLDNNEGSNTLHGGKNGFSQVIWEVKSHQQSDSSSSITLQYHSTDGEQGFPGDLLVSIKYTITDLYKLTVEMKAKPVNKSTAVNLAQHTYWNLNNHNKGNILSHELQIHASHITPLGDHSIPTGEISSVKGTPYDFLDSHVINSSIGLLPARIKGYDINYVIDRQGMRPVARVYSSESGRVMRISSNAPGVQLYTGNSIHDTKGKGGFVYQNYAGLCLETQGFPDSVNHYNFPSQIVHPGQVYKHRMVYEFSVEKDADKGGSESPILCKVDLELT